MRFPEPTPARTEDARHGNLFLRIFWMFGGLIVIATIGFRIAGEPPWRFSTSDVLFWLAVLAALGARVVDGTRLRGLTADGRPTTRTDLRRYVLGLVTVSAVVWVTARAFEI